MAKDAETKRMFVRACRKLNIPVRLDGYGRYYPDTLQAFNLFVHGMNAAYSTYDADDMFREFQSRSAGYDAT